MLKYHLVRSGITVDIVGDGDRISFDMSDPDLAIENDAVFAAWAVLPIGMRLGQDILIDGLGDDETQANAARLAQIWSSWLPARFSPVGVSFTGRSASRPRNQEEDLVLYSGGVDSSYNLVHRRDAGRRQAVVTLHGPDYNLDRGEPFNALMEHTASFVSAFATRRMTVRSNMRRIYRKHGMSADVTHGFALAATLFLMRANFGAGAISADYSRAQEYMAFPWGTNSFTNAFFASADFRMVTDNSDLTRAEKLALIAGNDLVLRSLTFCKDRTARPQNCGLCSKCVRTKAMFMAISGEVPPIFIDRRLDGASLRAMDVSKRSELVFAVDLLMAAKQHGNSSLVPGLDDLEKRVRQTDKKSQTGLRKIANRFRKVFT